MIIPRNSQSLVVPVPKEHNYRIEAGRYASVVHKMVRVPRQSDQEDLLRIVFALNVPGKENFLNLAKAEFRLSLEHGSSLRNVLTRLLGKEVLAAMSGQEVNLESAIGKPADVQIEHIITSKRDLYDYPYVNVCDVQPPGTLVQTAPTSQQTVEQLKEKATK